MTEFQSIILGRKWKMIYQSEVGGAESIGGMACFPSREIYIRDDLKSEELQHALIHELTHAWMFELGQGQNQLKKHEFDEEFICELMAIHGERITTSANELHALINKHIKRKNELYRTINKEIRDKAK